jgi:hypothetical protein
LEKTKAVHVVEDHHVIPVDGLQCQQLEINQNMSLLVTTAVHTSDSISPVRHINASAFCLNVTELAMHYRAHFKIQQSFGTCDPMRNRRF